jgi:hypothetical protein
LFTVTSWPHRLVDAFLLPLLNILRLDSRASLPSPFAPIIGSTLKAKIAKLKSELINGPGGKSAGSKDAGRGFDVSKSGDTRIGLVGFPSVGKSTLLTQLTGTRSAVSEIEFTTLTWCVGLFYFRPLATSRGHLPCEVSFTDACLPLTYAPCLLAHDSIPGTMKYRGARIQVLDLPGIIEGAADGKGRGKQVISTARTCAF